ELVLVGALGDAVEPLDDRVARGEREAHACPARSGLGVTARVGWSCRVTALRSAADVDALRARRERASLGCALVAPRDLRAPGAPTRPCSDRPPTSRRPTGPHPTRPKGRSAAYPTRRSVRSAGCAHPRPGSAAGRSRGRPEVPGGTARATTRAP